MPVKVVFNEPAVESVSFESLSVNDSFKITTGLGAVYRKVVNASDGSSWMMEEATGNLFQPTNKPVVRVDVTVSIGSVKPKLARYATVLTPQLSNLMNQVTRW